jgi:hypothetical protein
MFSFKFTLRCQQSDIVPIICHRYQQHQRYLWQNLSPVSLILVVHLHLRISLQIVEKIRDDPTVSGAWGKMIHEKNLKQKISWHCPFNTSDQTIANVKESLTEKEANSRISVGKWMEGPTSPYRQRETDWPSWHAPRNKDKEEVYTIL